ncbi:outer membrane protein assembly factor BamD [Blattabacterium clevelandi]|uniref:outer membrane protein assembly factor BamD n=1 Tax=Blattabacterium clevelandi TaxID=164516 RepID=UPI000DE59AF9|nr:outer membrane protein assembly factor BamD [Blattabacterium clevelandi]
MNYTKIIFLWLFLITGCYNGKHLSNWDPTFYNKKNEISILENIFRKLNLFSKKKYLGNNYEENESFKRGLNYYFKSLNFDLDQKTTREAIENLNKFIKEYPNSSKIEEINEILNKLSKKLEKKDYYIANTYFFMKKYQSSLIYFQDFLNNFPKSNFKEDVLYKICLITYKLSINNNKNKKNQILNFLKAYYRYVKSYPNSPNIKKLKIFYEKLLK